MNDGQISYELKNNDYDSAMIITLGFDFDIIRKACNWVASHQDAFGDNILEIGCVY